MITSRILLSLLLAGSAFARPNILFIFSDDQSYKTVSCYPEALPGARTPNIDALAASGIRFTHAYMGSWCMASRASLLTGLQPHGIESMRMEGAYPGSTYDPQKCRFWPSTFRAGGYHTAHIGKWHTGTDTGWGRDWDYQKVWNRPLHSSNAGAYYARQRLTENGQDLGIVDGYSTDNYTEWACDFIRGKNRPADKPWYLWLCYGAIHGPTTPAERHKGKHKHDEVRVPADIIGSRPGKPAYLEKTQAWKMGPDGRIVSQKGRGGQLYEDFVHQSNDCVEALDEGVGALIAALKESGQLENTLVVFTADQGFGMGEHGLRMKLAPYDAAVRAPFIVSMPSKLPQGRVCARPVNSPDLISTFFSLAEIKPEWELHGRDLTALFKDPEGASWPHACFYENTGHDYGSDVARVLREEPKAAIHSGVPWYVALNDGRWKYVRYLQKDETEELYDLRDDPEELVNLADIQRHRAELERLRGALSQELARTRAGFADALPASRQMR